MEPSFARAQSVVDSSKLLNCATFETTTSEITSQVKNMKHENIVENMINDSNREHLIQ